MFHKMDQVFRFHRLTGQQQVTVTAQSFKLHQLLLAFAIIGISSHYGIGSYQLAVQRQFTQAAYSLKTGLGHGALGGVQHLEDSLCGDWLAAQGHTFE